MASASDFLENKVIDHMLRNQAYTVPTTIYLATYTAAPSDSGGGTESTGGSYARQAVTLSAASGGATSNSVEILFTNMPSSTITHWGIFDAVTSGNLLLWGALVAPKVLAAGATARVIVGALDIAVL